MKIYVLPVEEKFQPGSQPFQYPAHNKDYGVEQDFHRFLLKGRGNFSLTESVREAEWHYLPIYWTRWHLNHDYGKFGREELREEAARVVLDDRKTFTICQYDDGPGVGLGKAVIFLSSRRFSWGIDIPLLSSPHRVPIFRPRKVFKASFVGRLGTYPLRERMAKILKGRKDVFIFDGDKGSRFFVQKTLASYLALCPRGYGGSSFRFFEAMQLGIVPLLLGDLDTRPFKRFLDWESCSFYANSAERVLEIIDSVNEKRLLEMGRAAASKYKKNISYQKWCNYVLRELKLL